MADYKKYVSTTWKMVQRGQKVGCVILSLSISACAMRFIR